MAKPKKADTPPVDNEHVEKGAEQFDETDETKSEPEPDEPDEVLVEHDTTAVPEQGPGVGPESTVDADTGSAPAAGDTVGVTAPEPSQKRSLRDRVRDAETRWEKDFEEIILDIHDHVFGTSPPHEETTAKRQAAAEAPKE